MKKRIYWLVIIASLLGFVGSYYWFTHKSGPIVVYNASRDRAEVLDIFEKNWYWLTSQTRQDGYSPEYRFDNLRSSDDLSTARPLQAYVYRHENKTVGFVTLYKENFYQGKILHLCVDNDYRKRGFARALIDFALNKIKAMGCSQVCLVTRTNNIKAQKLYKKIGFVEVGQEGVFVEFVYNF